MKTISLWEPWASLLAHGLKRIETRGWGTDFRGEVAIHATAGGLTQSELFDTCSREPFLSCLKSAGILKTAMSPRQVAAAFPRGHIIAVGTLADCNPSDSVICLPGVFEEHPELDTDQERAFGNYDAGRYGLIFENVSLLHEPVPFKSRQGKLLDLDYDTEQRVRAVWW